MFIIGNPTNIYLATSAGINFVSYVQVMGIPTLLMGITEVLIIFLLFNKKLKIEMAKNGVMKYGSNSPEDWLINHGWMKIHNNECYGFYRWYKNDPEETKLYCPTDIQINMICDYADKYYGGMIYTEAQTFGSRVTHKEAYKTSAIRQMDEIKLHETFKL